MEQIDNLPGFRYRFNILPRQPFDIYHNVPLKEFRTILDSFIYNSNTYEEAELCDVINEIGEKVGNGWYAQRTFELN